MSGLAAARSLVKSLGGSGEANQNVARMPDLKLMCRKAIARATAPWSSRAVDRSIAAPSPSQD